ncbi:MAG: hypothetical protein WD407_14230 [Rhodospirillales bacterium]
MPSIIPEIGGASRSDQYLDDAGRTCKPFTQRIQGRDRLETASGDACQQADGSWKVTRAG